MIYTLSLNLVSFYTADILYPLDLVFTIHFLNRRKEVTDTAIVGLHPTGLHLLVQQYDEIIVHFVLKA